MRKQTALLALLGGLSLAACLARPAGEPTAAPTITLSPTITLTPTVTSTPTVTPTAAPTSTAPPVPNVLPQPAVTSAGAAWEGRFAGIEPGAARETVEALLGPPDEQREMTFPEVPFFGPQEGLTSLLEPGEPYEEWVYKRGEFDYYVWFSALPDDPAGAWGVVLTARYPADAVF